MSFYKHIDKKSGDGLALTDWNILSNAVAGNQGLTLALSTSDKIGIGKTNPSEKLEVNGNAVIGSSGETLKVGNIGHENWAGVAHTSRANTGDYALIQNAAGATILNSKSNQILHFRQGNVDKMVIKNGNVGIGNTNPGNKLVVNGDAKATNFIGNGSQLTNIDAAKITSGKISIDRLPAGLVVASGGLTTFTNSVKVKGRRLDVHSNQTLFNGLHSEARRAQLVLSSEYSDLVIASSQANNNHGSTLTFATYNPSDANDYRKFVINHGNWGTRKQFLEFGYDNANGRTNPHSNINNADTVLTLDGINKYVGIGTRSPEAPLSIAAATGKESAPNGSMHITNDCILFGGNNNGKQTDSAQISAGRHATNSLCIVGMGATAAARKIDMWAEGGLKLHGKDNVFTMTTDSKNLYFHLTTSNHGSSRKMRWDGDSNWDSASDVNLKTNIAKEENILDRIINLDVKTFNWKDDPHNERKMIGFMAQDVQPYFPSLVKEYHDADTQESNFTLPYASFGILAVGAIKELKEQTDEIIASLKTEIETLKSKLKK